jgi:hypothetical protein
MQANPFNRRDMLLYIESQLQFPEALFSDLRQVF